MDSNKLAITLEYLEDVVVINRKMSDHLRFFLKNAVFLLNTDSGMSEWLDQTWSLLAESDSHFKKPKPEPIED